MKTKFIFSILFAGVLSFAQVGINTDDPQATLHIATDAGQGAEGIQNGGMILDYPGEAKNSIPSIDLAGVTALNNQNILVQDEVTGEINHMKRWAVNYMPARPSHLGGFPIAINEQDYTVLVRGNVVLPTGNEYIGKLINLVYDSQTNVAFTVTVESEGQIKDNAYLVDFLDISRRNSSYTLQSDGNRWYVVDGFQREDIEEVELISLYDGDTVGTGDTKILVKGNINLGRASRTDIRGREVTLIFNGNLGDNFTITAPARTPILNTDGTTTTTWGLNASNGGKALKVRSNASNWVVLTTR